MLAISGSVIAKIIARPGFHRLCHQSVEAAFIGRRCKSGCLNFTYVLGEGKKIKAIVLKERDSEKTDIVTFYSERGNPP
ncbi:MAG: hypothetical protein ACR2PT_15835, partial [Endozoicomonas sp.]